MNNKDIDDKMVSLIASGEATTAKDLASTLKLSETDVGNCLRRAKAAGLIEFDKPNKRWIKSSAPAPDAGVGSANPPTGGKAKKDPTMSNENSVSDIDEAINNAKNSTKKAGEAKRARLSAEERAQRDQQRTAEAAEKKKAREEERARKKADRESQRKPAHMSKVDKAASRLPQLNQAATDIFKEATTGLDAAGVSALAAHLIHFNRVQSTNRALEQKVEVGHKVRITGGDARYIGKTGTVSKAQRIRCYVDIPGAAKPVYLFTSDVEVIGKQASTATA